MASEIRYGIVGCAGMGTNHADVVRDAEGATLAACADVSEENARAFAESYGTEWYTDPGAMAVEADLDAVSVCTPNGTHAEIVADLAAAGVDVLCEKPLEVTPERVARTVESCEEAGVKLGCILQRRTFGGPRLAREAAADGRLGELVLADVQVKWHREPAYYEDVAWHGTTDLDGGILLTQALHGVDLLQWAAGGVDRVAAGLDTLHHDVEAPDTAALMVEFSEGGYGQLAATTATYPQRPITLQVHGTEGTVRWHEDDVDEAVTVDGPIEDAAEPFPMGVGIPGQVRDFLEAIREDREPMVTPVDAREALDIVFAAQRSSERGEWVDVGSIRGR
ncbi:Gfo/Idh/MocA family protein [Saliphagus infecundisoli]|uniref:Gfo/Idh/MocA family protein n=1 Tax=Saliphagus infecundisoli TaxID=1849069 RepID=A0ABD5QI28_9EURY|nr:Gfo/Idh/MocA family oxidoreductase [Saliphagus infecundisoli]